LIVLFSVIALVPVGPNRLSAGPPAPRVHVLTPERNRTCVKVRPGDEIVIKLPMQMPFKWGILEKAENLREIHAPLKLIPIDGEKAREKPGIGASQTLSIRYRIESLSKDQTLHWVYCVGGRTNPDGKPVKPTEPLKPDELPTKRGTYFRIVLSPQT
jgi:hypothetical protein